MRRSNYFTDNIDLQKVFSDPNAFSNLFESTSEAMAALETWRDVLDLVGRFAGEEVSQRALEVDRLGVTHSSPVQLSEPMKRNLEDLAALGLTGLSLPEKYGGSGLPFSVMLASIELLARADASTMINAAFFSSPAAMILRFGNEAQKQSWIPKLAKGELLGGVAMTEPQAGSDVGAISTKATKQTDGSWRLTGRKQFISAGHDGLCLVLARTVEGSIGLEGLGMFIVPRRIEGKTVDNYITEKAEEKETLKGSPTCSLVFEDSHAEIMGEVGDGWRQITSFMNEARVAVAAQGLGTIQAAYVAASDYATLRVQSSRPIREHPMVANLLVDMRSSLAALRALVYECGRLYDEVELAKTDSEKKTAMLELRERTPLVKWLGAEDAVRLTRNALQVHGGYGVVREYDVERFLRNSPILAIYEGTSQIQGLMATKDLLKKLFKSPALLFSGNLATYLIKEHASDTPTSDRNYARACVSSSIRTLMRRAFKRKLGWLWPLRASSARLTEDDLGEVMLYAERLCASLARIAAANALAGTKWASPEDVALSSRSAMLLARTLLNDVHSPEAVSLDAVRSWRRERGG